jgi:ribA/ribD-fused uncharacterized protein
VGGNNTVQEDILTFSGQYRFLSNFYPSPFWWGGILWFHAEGAYQAAKSCDPDVVTQIALLENPADAKRAGKHIILRRDWETIKYDVMYDVVTAKFEQNPALMRRLLATYPAHLEEGNTWRDTTWGVCPVGSGIGKNWLGQILMDIRDEHR